MQGTGDSNNGGGVVNSSVFVNSGDVTVNIPDEVDTHAQQTTTDVPAPTSQQQETSSTDQRGRTCCMRTRKCLESSYFSFTLGFLFFAGGIALIGVSTQLPGDYFLVGPFCIAAGTILFIRGCINRLALKQQLREQVEQEQRIVNRALTRAQRSQRNEELALSQENLIIPPNYFEVVERPKTTASAPAPRRLVSTQSQTMFDLPPRTSADSATVAQPVLHRLASVQSQTSFPSAVSVGVDTSDLPAELDTVSMSPPSYERATTRSPSIVTTRQEVPAVRQSTPTSRESDSQPAAVTYYLPEEDDAGVASTSTATQSTST